MTLAPYSFVWDWVNQDWILCDRDGDEISRHPSLLMAEEAAANEEAEW